MKITISPASKSNPHCLPVGTVFVDEQGETFIRLGDDCCTDDGSQVPGFLRILKAGGRPGDFWVYTRTHSVFQAAKVLGVLEVAP